MSPRLSWRRLISVLPLAVVLGCGGDRSRGVGGLLRLRGATMGTTWSVQLPTGPGVVAGEVRQLVQGQLDSVNGAMSTYRRDSELSRFNDSTGDVWFPIGAHTAQVIGTALDVARRSGGALDPTVGPLVDLWGFGPHREGSGDRREIPSEAAIRRARAVVGWADVELRLDPPAVRKRRAGLRLDLSAVAKGHGVDRVADALLAHGHPSFFVEVGGEVRTAGTKAPGVAWRVAIERPTTGAPRALLVLPLRDQALASSGGYRNFFEVAGHRFSHSIDPRTGRPVTHKLTGVSVAASTCEVADAWATALMVLGLDAGLEVATREGLAALFVIGENDAATARPTPAFAAAFPSR